jgi:hypothetical protein
MYLMYIPSPHCAAPSYKTKYLCLDITYLFAFWRRCVLSATDGVYAIFAGALDCQAFGHVLGVHFLILLRGA